MLFKNKPFSLLLIMAALFIAVFLRYQILAWQNQKFELLENRTKNLEKQLLQLYQRNSLTSREAREQTELKKAKQKSPEEQLVDAVAEITPAVVSIVVSKDMPQLEVVYENPFGDDPFFKNFDIKIPRYQQKGTVKKQIGAGSGFIVSSDGYIVTNKHVAADEQAEYVALLASGVQKTAKVIARDPRSDIAILKIEGANYSKAKLGNSDLLKSGQTVMAIGNALGEFANTVSKGIISGLGRSITASTGAGQSEQLIDVIQTDAAINPGNSGGPLVNLAGEVIGVSVAIVQGSQSIGFALPINDIKKRVEQVRKSGKIIRPLIGIRYALVTPEIKSNFNLSADQGVVLVNGTAGEIAVIPGSPADKAGLLAGDVITAINGKPISALLDFERILKNLEAGNTITLSIVRGAEKLSIKVTLGEM